MMIPLRATERVHPAADRPLYSFHPSRPYFRIYSTISMLCPTSEQIREGDDVPSMRAIIIRANKDGEKIR